MLAPSAAEHHDASGANKLRNLVCTLDHFSQPSTKHAGRLASSCSGPGLPHLHYVQLRRPRSPLHGHDTYCSRNVSRWLAKPLGSEPASEPEVTLNFSRRLGSFEQSKADGAATHLQIVPAVPVTRTFGIFAQAEMNHLILLLARHSPGHPRAPGQGWPAHKGERANRRSSSLLKLARNLNPVTCPILSFFGRGQ
jgi:hypothetical protein